tara:strand:+ start:365 stop:643 length:279 start_codon:yes stop_codon:yes gene_type:complete
MKKILFLLFFSFTLIHADELSLDFYEPNISNAYQGRLSYDPLAQDYPIDEMRRLCEPYTGVDTAQIKCGKQIDSLKMVVCKYKCSMHWSITD